MVLYLSSWQEDEINILGRVAILGAQTIIVGQ